jgi:peptidoglycan/LPS O-acetylase OafA/YrhL
MFFVISGYCITAAAARAASGPAPLRLYFWRRFRRIVPPAWSVMAAVVAVMLAVPWLYSQRVIGFAPFPRPEALTAWQWAGTLTLTFTWLHHFAGEPVRFLAHYWTLCYEEQFYVVTGLAVVATRTHWLKVLAGVTLAVIALRALLPVQALDGFFFDGRWLLFAAGVGVYAHLHHACGLTRLVMPAVCLLAVMWALTAPDLGHQLFPFSLEVLESAVFAMVLMGLHAHDHALRTRPRWLHWVGRRSFSIYLVHWPISQAIVQIGFALGIEGFWPHAATSLPLSIAASLAAGGWFYDAVERHCLSHTPASTPGVHPAAPLPGHRPAAVR